MAMLTWLVIIYKRGGDANVGLKPTIQQCLICFCTVKLTVHKALIQRGNDAAGCVQLISARQNGVEYSEKVMVGQNVK